jgi:hypothetical protein
MLHHALGERDFPRGSNNASAPWLLRTRRPRYCERGMVRQHLSLQRNKRNDVVKVCPKKRIIDQRLHYSRACCTMH